MLNDSILLTKASGLNDITSNRHQILQQLLENKAGLQIDELAKYLNISRTAVQNHFLMLEKEGLIKKHTRLKTLGRPSIIYVLTDKGVAYFPKGYALFSVFLLSELKNEIGSDRLIGYMQKLGKKIANQYCSSFAGLNEEDQFNTLKELMQELGFYANLAVNPETQAIEIYAHNCIYHAIAQKIHEVCVFDQTLIAELTNKKVELRTCMARGDEVCCFRMGSGTRPL